jgi:protein involved in polysaccharide export with SLBB domain
LAKEALQPYALVIVKKSDANAVTAAAEVVTGAKIPLLSGGNRLLKVIAAVGGVKALPAEILFGSRAVGSSRRHRFGSSFSNPAEDIYTEQTMC